MIDNIPLSEFGSVRIKRLCNGLGLSGICVSELSFTAPAPFYAARTAKVTVTGLDNLPNFYISSRSQRRGVVTVTCLDKLAFSDIPFPYEQLTVKKGKIPIGTVMNLLSMALGEGIPRYGGIPSWLKSIPYASLKDVTCVDILQKISEACCGVWVYTSENYPYFLKFGEWSGGASAQKHTALDVGAEIVMNNVICTNSKGTQFSRGTTDHIYDTIRISSEFITDEGCEEIWGRAAEFEGYVWSCEKCLLTGNTIPNINCKCSFAGGGEYIVGNIDCSVTASGIYATLSGGSLSGDEISTRGALTRAIDSFANRKTGNIRHTPYQGIIIEDDEDEDENDENEEE